MNESNPLDQIKLTIAERIEIDRQCMEFDQAWHSAGDQPPALLGWLERVPLRLRTELFRELLRVEIEYRTHRGMACDEKSTIDRFPDFAETVRQVLRLTSDTAVETEWGDVSIELAAQQAAQLFELAKQFEADSAGGGVPDLADWAARQAKIAKTLEQTLKGAARQVQSANSTQPQRLGDFQIIRQIGRGGMGAVFEAEQLSLHRRVALKVLWFAASSDQEAINRFAREATTIANLHHTNIVPIFAVGNQDGINYYAMQLIDGNSLDKLSGLSPFVVDADRVVDWGLQAAEALTHAHERGIVHRDIKPSNLMLDRSGRLWLTDFGLAKSSTDQTLSLAGAMLGTPRYMSPEQASTATQSIDHRSDIYSLGATLYELLAGRPVFDGDSPLRVIQQILSQDPQPLEKAQPTVPRDLATIIMKCLSKDRADRYATARDLAQDLRCVSEGRPIRARRTSQWEIAGKWMKRHQSVVRNSAAVIAASLFVLIGVGTAWFSYRQYHIAQVEIKSLTAPVVTEFLNSQGQRVGLPVTVPTQSPVELPAEKYVLRASTPGLPSLDYSVSLRPRDHLSIQLDVDEQRIDFPLLAQRGYRVLPGRERATIVSWSETELKVERVTDSSDPTTPDAESPVIALTPLGFNPAIKFVVSLGCDLDDDGYEEVLLCLSQQSALRAVSRSTGFVWHQLFAGSTTTVPAARDDNLFPWIRGEILQPPILVPDQDGDGKQDLLVSVGQNPSEPRADTSLVQRFIALISAKDGQEIWRHSLNNEEFQLPVGRAISDALQWHLTDPRSTGSGSSSVSFVRNGRNLRHLDRSNGITAPHVEAQQIELINVQQQCQVLVRTGTRLQLLDLATGRHDQVAVDTGIVSAVPFVLFDLDADHSDELLLIESLNPVANPNASAFVTSLPQSRLVAWSIERRKEIWQRTLEAKVPVFDADQRRLSWPAFSTANPNSILVPNGVSHAVGYLGESLPWSAIECLRPDNGEVCWNRHIANCDSWTDHFAFGTDINGDWIDDVFIASMWGSPLQLVTECRCGASGNLLWVSEETLAQNSVDSIESVAYLEDQQQFQIVLVAPNHPKSAFQFDTRTGQLKQFVDGFERLVFADADGDRAQDWFLIHHTKTDAVPRETITIARGNAAERWRRLGEPVCAAADFDGDQVDDLLVGSESSIQAISGGSGATIWQHATDQRLSEWRFFSWESDRLNLSKRPLDGPEIVTDAELQPGVSPSTEANSVNTEDYTQTGRASREAWDVDHDGTPDVVVQMGNNSGNQHVPCMILSGKSGKRLWQGGAPTSQRTTLSPLQCLDLDSDGRLEILMIDQVIPTVGSSPGSAPKAAGSQRSVPGTSLWEVGNANPEWSKPISDRPGNNGIFPIDTFNFAGFPLARLIDLENDAITDLILISEKTNTDASGSQLFLSAVSGADGHEKWSLAIDVKSFDQRTLATCDRVETCDLDQDGRDEVLYLAFENRSEGESFSQWAVLQAIDARTGHSVWKYERPVNSEFLSSNDSTWVKPIVLRSTTMQPRVALCLREPDRGELVAIIGSDGKLQGEYKKVDPRSFGPNGFPCWVGDCNGDGQDELLFDDGELQAWQIFGELKSLVTYPVRATEPDVAVRIVKDENGAAQVWVSNEGKYWVQGFEASSGKQLWKCQGPDSNGLVPAGPPVVQFLGQTWSPRPDEFTEKPIVVFNGYHGVSTAHRIDSIADSPSQVSLNSVWADRKLNSNITDWRMLRPLPWASSNRDLGSYAGPENLAMFIGFVLLCSFLLVVLPVLVIKATWRRWISHLAALLCLSAVVAVGWLFFGNQFQIPFMNERPAIAEKIALGLQYAPLWLVITSVPSWLFNGRWWRLFGWSVIVVSASSAVAAISITENVANAPLSAGERFDLSFSPMILLYGVFIASWLGLGLAVSTPLVKRVWRTIRPVRIVGSDVGADMTTGSMKLKTPKMPIVPRYSRTLYFVGLAIWIGYVSLFPNWQGSLYHTSGIGGNSEIIEGGTFGLQESNWHWPVWEPPKPSGMMAAEVRWPWQAITANAYIEVDLRLTLGRMLSGFILIGLVVGIAGLVVRREQQDPALIYIWSVSLSWVVAWMVALFLAVVTFGELPNATLLLLLIGSGLVVGMVFGKFVVTRPNRVKNHNTLDQHPKSADRPPKNSIAPVVGYGSAPGRADNYPFPRYRWLIKVAAFLIGVIAGTGIGFLAATTLPGILDPEWVPVFGPGLGGPRPATMHWIGALLVVCGVLVGLPIYYWRVVRSFGFGFLMAIILAGTGCLFY